jgi:hypothetical protein
MYYPPDQNAYVLALPFQRLRQREGIFKEKTTGWPICQIGWPFLF